MYEKEIKQCLMTYRSKEGDKFIDELSINNDKCFADLIKLNDKITGYEIKSKYDSLKRLGSQLDSYTSSCNRVYVCCHEKHYDKVNEIINDQYQQVGIIKFDDTKKFVTKKRAKIIELTSKQYLDYYWSSHLTDILKNRGQLKDKQVRTVSKYNKKKMALQMLSEEVIKDFTLEMLKTKFVDLEQGRK